MEVTCGAEPPTFLEPDATAVCLPLTAADRLGRILTLQQRGAPDSVVLGEVEAALRLRPGEPAVRVELASLRVDTLIRLGRTDEALRAAVAVLDEGAGARAGDLHRVAGRLAGLDCAQALPHLTWLEANSVLGEDAPQLDACRR